MSRRRPTLAARLAHFALGFDTASLSAGRRARLPLILADFLGCALAGASLPEARTAFVLAQPGAVEVPGTWRSLTPESAAIALGTLGSLLQLHDGYGNGGNHPSCCIVAALWSMRGEAPADASPAAAVLRLHGALAVAYEIANRLAASAHPRLTLAGLAPTSATGAIGAAAGLARLLGLDAATAARAISNAAFSFPLAALRGLTDHGAAVPVHGGLAARCAIEAVRLAQAGFGAGDTVLEGGADPGVLAVLQADAAQLVPEQWRGETLDRVYFKPIPACRHAQPPIDALEPLWRAHPGLDCRDIVGIEVQTYAVARRFGKPPAPALELYDRLMSVSWAVASALRHGRYGLDNILAPTQDAELQRLCGLVQLTATDEFQADYPRRLGARVLLRLRDGRQLSGESRMEYGSDSEDGPYSPPGTHMPPFDAAAVRAKFEALAGRSLQPAAVQALWRSVHA